MSQNTTWVALDTAKRKHVVAVLFPGNDQYVELSVANEPRAIRRFVRKIERQSVAPVRMCYEAGPCGFGLQRQILAAASGELECQVIAPSLIPYRPGDRVKTDRRDARKLVDLFKSGHLTEVAPPTEAEESVRDLMRSREDIRQDLVRSRHRLSKLLLRRGIIFSDGKAWTVKHRKWLKSLAWDHPQDVVVFDDYYLAITHLEERMRSLEATIKKVSEEDPYREPVGWLRCMRGIDTVTAMTVVAELHGFARFHSPRQLMSYLGLTPSEYSSGDRVRRGGITKTGNGHVRRILVEAARHNRHKPAVSYALRKRREDQPAWAVGIADSAMVRLHRRLYYLKSKGKTDNKAITAVARELVGFIWAMMCEGSRRNELASA